jgi:hypothetical protein
MRITFLESQACGVIVPGEWRNFTPIYFAGVLKKGGFNQEKLCVLFGRAQERNRIPTTRWPLLPAPVQARRGLNSGAGAGFRGKLKLETQKLERNL